MIRSSVAFLFFMLFQITVSYAQTIHGVILDQTSQQSISGVNIITKDDINGTSTDLNGRFTINVSKNDTLKISHVGYKTKMLVPEFTSPDAVIYLERYNIMLSEVEMTVTKNNRVNFSQSASISYLPKEDIKENLSRSMAEAMMTTAGVWMQKTNHGGGSPFVRGLTGNYTLILVDGIRLNNSTFRYGPNQYFNTVSPHTVNSVEVLRGAGSTLYGSDAIGGTLNVHTATPTFSKNKKLYGHAGGQFMSHNMEYTGNLLLGGNTNNFAYLLNGSIRKFGDLQAGKGLGVEAPSAYNEKDMSFSGLWMLKKNQKLTFNYQLLKQDSVPRYDKVTQDDYQYYFFSLQQRQLAYIKYKKDWQNSAVKNLNLTGSYQQSNEIRDTRKIDSPVNKNERDDVSTIGFNAHMNAEIAGKAEAIVGLDFYYDMISSSRKDENTGTGETIVYPRGLYPDGSKAVIAAIYNTYLHSTKHWVFQFGWRYNYTLNIAYDEQFGDIDHTTSALIGDGAVNYRFKKSRVYASVNSAFRAPNINDIGSLGNFDYGVEVPAQGLKPERSNNYELGYKLAANKFSFNLATYLTHINDLIARIPSSYNGDTIFEGDRIYTKANVGKAFVTGVEADFEVLVVERLSIRGNITYAYGQNTTKEEPLRRIPPLFGNLSIRYGNDTYFVILQNQAAGKQDRLSGGDIDDYRIADGGTPAWYIVNIKGGCKWKRIGFRLAFNNIFNQAYRVHGSGVDGYGRHVAGSVSLYF